MKAGILTIGDEILLGDINNTNVTYISNQLKEINVPVLAHITIGDIERNITDMLNHLYKEVDLVLVTGGLGPTNDDITKETLSAYFGDELSLNEDALQHIETLFKRIGIRMNELNKQQAVLPMNAKLIPNVKGTAYGMWFIKNGKHCISMPGVPPEMKAMMELHVVPELEKMISKEKIIHRHVHVHGLPESILAEKISDWEQKLSSNIKLAYLPSPGIVKLRLTIRGTGKELLHAALDQTVDDLHGIIGEHIYSTSGEQLEQVVGKLLAERKKTLSTAESCTGGYIAHLITSISGSSDYFEGAVVSYSNRIKNEVLHIDKSLIEKHGAASKEVVEAMAKGVMQNLGTDFSIATSGIAGPTGGSEQKPVGTVWIAVGGPNGIKSKKFQFGNDRIFNIRRSAATALTMLRKEILNSFEN